MNSHGTSNTQQTVLVIGGHGFIGRHITQQLTLLGARVIIGTRQKNSRNQERHIALHKMRCAEQWAMPLKNIDVVVNAAGILRQRFNETYEQVHHHAVANLAEACRQKHIRLVHISALGLSNPVKSRFISSKLHGEEALKDSHADWAIVRPSLVDGNGGFGAKWFRRVAQWPIHMTPANAKGLFSPIHIDDLGEAVAKIALVVMPENDGGENDSRENRVYELGGSNKVTIREYLQCLRQQNTAPLTVTIPAFIARVTSHLFDFLHLSPYSFGHYELLKYDNYPAINRLTAILGRPAKIIGIHTESQAQHHAKQQGIKQKRRVPV